MTIQLLLLVSLAATDLLIGVASLGVFWIVFGLAALPMYLARRQAFFLRGAPIWLIATIALMAASVGLNGIGRPESVAYASLFALYGFWLMVAAPDFTPEAVGKAMKVIIVAYFLSVALAILLLMAGATDLNSFPLTHIWLNENTGEVRPIGFSSEPSYAAFIVMIAWLTLVRLGQIHPREGNGFAGWTAITLVSLQLLGSIYGYLLILIVILTTIFLLPKRTRIRVLVAGSLLAVLGYLLLPIDDDARPLRIISAIVSGDLDAWLVEDTSSFFRVGPFFAYMLSANFGDIQTWFGHGATSGSLYFVDLFREHISKEVDAVELGFVPAYLYDYGLLPAAAFVGFLFSVTLGRHRVAMVVTMLLLVFNANFSTQIIWFAVTCAVLSQVTPSPPAPFDEASQNIR